MSAHDNQIGVRHPDEHGIHESDGQHNLQRSRSTATLRDEPDGFEDVMVNTRVGAGMRKETLKKDSDVASLSDGDTLIVDWDGPDDPENPKK